MLRAATLVVACLPFLAVPTWAQQEGALGASLKCSNCDDPELLAWLQPLDPEAERFTCSLEVALEIEPDGEVVDAHPIDRAPGLCEERATRWALATRWDVEGREPVTLVRPLEFEIRRKIPPECVERCDYRDVHQAVLHEVRDQRGFHCRTRMGFRIGTDGRVFESTVYEGDTDPVCLRGFRMWARSSRWSIAHYEGDPVPVWVSQWLEIEARR